MSVSTLDLRVLSLIFFAFLGGVNAGERPNILVILTDDMGFSDLGCFGGEIETPNLDSLAAGGLRFTEFYNTARCWPTRATLLSGRYSDGLSRQQVTIPEVLRKAGYETGMVGKWHLGKNPKEDGPVQRGFDQFYGTMAGANSYWDPESLTRNTEAIEPEGEDSYYTDTIGAEAAQQIEAFAKSEKPFFQYVAFTAGHWPLHAPEATIQKYLERYQGGWGRIKYVNDQHQKYDVSKVLPATFVLANWNSDVTPVRTHHFFEDGTKDIFCELEKRGVFFSSPLDLDFSMIRSYSQEYNVQRETPTESTINAVLGKSHHSSGQYNQAEQELFLTYHRLFKLGSKPAAHIEAMAKLSDDELLANMPASLSRLADAVIAKLESLPE